MRVKALPVDRGLPGGGERHPQAPHPTSPFRLSYLPALDGLRGCAVLLVLLYHVDYLFGVAGGRFNGGYVGVDLFFVLSGFLITALLVQEYEQTGTIHFAHFYARRALRLAPCLGLVLAACLLTAALAASPEEARDLRRGVLLSACYAGNFFWCLARPAPELAHTWSLAVEEHFYLLWPFLLGGLLRLRLRRRWLAGLLALGMVGSAVARAALAWRWGILAGGMLLPGRADALLSGCLLALLAAWGRLPRPGWPRRLVQAGAGAAALLLLVPWPAQWGPFMIYGGYTLVAAASALVLAAVLTAPRSVDLLLSARPLVWVGRLSYALYLWHWPLLLVLWKAGQFWRPERSPYRWPLALGAVGLSLLLAALTHYAVERPLLRLKHRFRAAPPSPPPGAVQSRAA
jgi:peptidoglycan/LPS O-acetylase OafA/YrhL